MLYSTAVAWPQVPPLPHFDAAAHDNGAWSADADAQLLRVFVKNWKNLVTKH
jgi:hypothetical protein